MTFAIHFTVNITSPLVTGVAIGHGIVSPFRDLLAFEEGLQQQGPNGSISPTKA